MALRVSSVALSETIKPGLPRWSTIAVSSRATRRPEIEVSGTAKSSITRNMRGERTSVCVAKMPGSPRRRKRSPCRINTLCVFNGIEWLILLDHKFRRLFCDRGRMQHWHRSSVVAIATARKRRIVAIELGTWRCGRIGGAAGSVTTGKRKFFDCRGATWC